VQLGQKISSVRKTIWKRINCVTVKWQNSEKCDCSLSGHLGQKQAKMGIPATLLRYLTRSTVNELRGVGRLPGKRSVNGTVGLIR